MVAHGVRCTATRWGRVESGRAATASEFAAIFDNTGKEVERVTRVARGDVSCLRCTVERFTGRPRLRERFRGTPRQRRRGPGVAHKPKVCVEERAAFFGQPEVEREFITHEVPEKRPQDDC